MANLLPTNHAWAINITQHFWTHLKQDNIRIIQRMQLDQDSSTTLLVLLAVVTLSTNS
jgi:hypothetical protein